MNKHATSLATPRTETAPTITRMRRAPEPNTGLHDRPDVRDQHIDRLQREFWKLETRYRAREQALEHLAGALAVLRRANHALTDENAILRLELERRRGREAARP